MVASAVRDAVTRRLLEDVMDALRGVPVGFALIDKESVELGDGGAVRVAVIRSDFDNVNRGLLE